MKYFDNFERVPYLRDRDNYVILFRFVKDVEPVYYRLSGDFTSMSDFYNHWREYSNAHALFFKMLNNDFSIMCTIDTYNVLLKNFPSLKIVDFNVWEHVINKDFK